MVCNNVAEKDGTFNDSTHNDSGCSTRVAGTAGDPGASSDSLVNEGLPVTPLVTTPPNTQYQKLLCGIDSLDLGLYVSWGSDWKRRLPSLDKMKQQARKKGGLLIQLPSGRSCIFKPGGKGENYRFHLQFAEYNLFIGKTAQPTNTPNVYLSIASQTLWLHGISTAITWITEDIKAIGNGTIQSIKPSRVDLCTDFYIPGGLDHDFLLSHKVTHNETEKFYRGKNRLETFYVGDAQSPTQLRIYNKGLEVQKINTKLWFLSLWGKESFADIWRLEFQLRRGILKQLGVETLEDLERLQAGIWSYLTSKWFSLRIPDNEKAERRTIHPLWLSVQECAQSFGQVVEIQRVTAPAATASPEWYLSHIDGCLSSFAALLGINTREEALISLKSYLGKHKAPDLFEETTRKKSIQRGTLLEGGQQ